MGGMLMQTDSEELLHAGIKVATLAWKKFLQVSKWDSQSPELVVTHQVGKAHQFEIEKALGYDSVKSFTSYESLGNCGDYPEADRMIEERAWSSPIWHLP